MPICGGGCVRYGLPYIGSKNAIASKVIGALPGAEAFVDVFAGGCSMTHAAMLSGRYSRFVANDRNGMFPRLFQECVGGRFQRDPGVSTFVTRDAFHATKTDDSAFGAYVACCWSFGNNLRDYLYSRGLEDWKRAGWESVVNHDDTRVLAMCGLRPDYGDGSRYHQWRRFVREHEDEIRKGLQSLQSLQSLESLERLQSLESIESLESQQNIEVSSCDFSDLDLSGDAVAYCDPPYRCTHEHYGGFDFDGFYEWALSQTVPVFVSEYSMPDDFICIAEFQRCGHLSATNNANRVSERLFVPRSQLDNGGCAWDS